MNNWIDILVSQRTLQLFDGDNKLIKSYSIGIGKIMTPTPIGTYIIVNKQTNPGGSYGSLWMGLSKPYYGIHGTNDPSSIGKYASEGCIRMHNQDVIELASKSRIGTKVVIRK